ncbi:hypothetical protein SUDANB126_07070 [Streptomyces sp. enrichment culture]
MEHLGDPDAVLIVDDTGFLKKGVRSAGVQRQYSGTAGRTENSQIGVFLAYATSRGRTLIDRRLYLPTSWTDDRDRCRRAGIDDSIAFATKVAMAKAMVRRAIAGKVPFGWVRADAAYGFSKGRRSELEQVDVFRVMATTRHDTVVTRWALDHPVHDLFPGLPRQKWKRRSCGQGAHGRRVFDWARVEVRPRRREDRWHWVLARRSVSRPDEISHYIAYCPADTTLDQLIRIAGSRWAVEECLQTAKQECGLDDYRVRRYPGNADTFEQDACAGAVAAPARCDEEGRRAALALAGGMGLRGQSAPGSAEGVIVRFVRPADPPFRPVAVACRWARTMVESICTSQSMSPAESARAWICCRARVNTPSRA